MSSVDPYSTHQNMLRKVVEATSGDVLELGIGGSSTPFLHELCVKQGRKVVSYDSDPLYFEEYRAKFEGPLHEFHLILNNNWDAAEVERPWSVVLIDHRPAARRRVDALRVAPHAEFVVCHDTQPDHEKFYGWSRAFRKVRYRYHDASQYPHTTVLSNINDLTLLQDVLPSGDSKDRSLTLVHYTSNRLDQSNPRFAQIVRDQIMRCVADGDYPLVTVSQQPMSFGVNICIGPQERSHLNLYKAVLIGAKAARTPFVGLVEDDVLYSPAHFNTRRPPLHKFSYDVNGWGINTWVQPAVFGYRNRSVINRLIAPREMLVAALEERFALYPDEAAMRARFGDDNPFKFWGDLGRYEKHLGVTVREMETFAAPEPSIIFSHEEAFGFLSRGKRKSTGEGLRAELYPWGSAEKVLGYWREGYKEMAA